MQATFGADQGDIGMDPMGFLNDMPLTGLFNFVGSDQYASPEGTVDQLLAKVKGIN
jgi:hypothetical protein